MLQSFLCTQTLLNKTESNKNLKNCRKEQLHGNFVHRISINMQQLETMEILVRFRLLTSDFRNNKLLAATFWNVSKRMILAAVFA